MKIFGSISELVDLAFRLAGGKQVKLRAATQTTSGNLVTVNVPDVAATGDTQSMVLNAATQTLSNKTLSSPTVSGGTINNSVIGGSTPAAGTFTDIVGSTLDINTSAELQTLTIPSFSTAGILHNNSSGAVSSSLIVNADVDAAAAIAFSKLATLASGNILVGSSTGVPTSRAVTGDVTIDDLGATTIGASKVLNSMLAGNIDRSKLATGTINTFVTNDNSGVMQATQVPANKALITDANGLPDDSSTTAAQIALLDDLNASKGKVQAQIDGKASSGANSDITSLTGLTTMLAPSQGGTGVNNGINTLTLAGPLTTSGNFTTTLAVTNNTSLTLPTSGTLATTSNKLSAFAATSSSELAGVISDETGSGSLVFGTNPTLATPTLNGHRYGVSGSLTVTANTLTPTADRSIQVVGTGATLQMIANPADGQEFILINASGSDFTIANNAGGTATNRILTGTGADFTFKASSAVSVVYNSGLGRWLLTGGGGGAGGLATTYVTAGSITAVNNTHYLTNLSASGQTITLPSGTDGAVIRFSDAGEVWNVYPLTIAPATGQRINNLATNETLVCDVKGGWVELSFNSTYGGWALMSLASTTGTSGSGSGEINAISNPSAASDTTGWTNASRVTSGSPLDPVVSTALSIANAAGAESPTSGGRFNIASLPSGLRSRKLKVSFYFSTPATDVYRVSVYAGTTRLALSSDSAGATTLPANVTGGYFEASFDSTTATAYSLNVTRTSGSTGACVITQVIVGPGINAQGAAISEWQSYTPTVSTGTWTTTRGYYRRVGSTLELNIYAGPLTADGSGVYSWTLPSGLTADLTALGASGVTPSLVDTDSGFNTFVQVGVAMFGVQGGVFYPDGITGSLPNPRVVLASTTSVAIVTGSNVNTFRANVLGSANGFSATTTTVIQIQARIPIAEWAGNGTVNLGAGAQVEYAWNSDTTDASTTASGFSYGPSGVVFGSYSTANRTKRVRFQYPIQTDDILQLEILRNGQWQPVEVSEFKSLSSTTGIDLRPVSGSTTDVDVIFGSAGYPATLGGGSNTWSAIAGSSGFGWRVRKAKASAPVGFGLAGTDGSSGLYQAGRAPGQVTGAAIASGMIGETTEVVLGPTAASVTNTPYTVGSTTLGAGVWLVYGQATFSPGTVTGNTAVVFDINTSAAFRDAVNITRLGLVTTASGTQSVGFSCLPLVVNSNGTSTVFAIGQYNFGAIGTSTMRVVIRAVRIA